ncbi:MAG: nicotinate mononucleotide-dependent phosphoribosyltransferase CobT [Candidatus Marinarcus sp.]|uniref:nicotinate mononucleotide-dependent phosphoribosyltransferase CobT n=1 Tax=Candidatus Marinarcus sp. TaxID=3100987 RepID=UPI003B001AE1
MSYKTILGTKDFIEFLRGKKATLLLSLSTTQTCQIEGLTQAGIPGMIYLTPTLDAEFVCTGELRSLEGVVKTSKGVPTPALITRAIHLLHPFSNIELLDLGMQVKPKVNFFKCHEFDIQPSASIATGANIDAMTLFQKGVEFGKNYECRDDYILLAESVPSGTTTAYATAKALGYECEDKFSSSYKNSPKSIRATVLQQALENIKDKDDLFEKVGEVADNMLIFNAGLILGAAYKQTKIVLAGGTQMACVLLLVNAIVKYMGGSLQSDNLALCTTSWVHEDENSDIKALLEMLDFPIHAYSADFNFATSTHPALKLYDEGEAKEGVGAGGALVYGLINGVSKEQIIGTLETFLKG